MLKVAGDPVLVENYLQHADHYSRRLAELNEKAENTNVKKIIIQSNTRNKETSEEDIQKIKTQ